MSFNGSGTFVINSTGQPVVANTVISATVFNALTADLASGLTNCITKDGQSTPTANIPMGSNKITGLANGTLIGDAANLGQVQSTVAKLISITGTDTVLGTMSPTLTAYAAGQLFYFVAGGANTGAVTLNVDGLGAKAITRDGSTALAAGDINSGEIVVVIYDGTRFQMINAANSFGNTTINGTLTVTGNTGLQANVSVTSALSVGGTFAVTGAATLGSTLAVTGKSDLPTVSTASANAAVAVITDLSAAGASITSANVGTAVITTGTVTNLTATSASVASVNAGVALLTTATVTNLTATGASIASANLGNAVISALTLTGVSVASANVGVANITDLRAVGASVTSANLGTAVVTNGTVTNLTATSASVASVNAAVALLTTATVTTLTASGASIASANIGNLQFTAASIASINAGVAVINNLTATSASIASANVGVALITTGTVTSLTATGASVASANVGTAVVTGLTVTGASIASMNGVTANITNVNATTVDATNVEVTNVKAKDGTAAIVISDTSGNVGIGGTAQGNIKVHALGTYPVLGGNANCAAFGATGTFPTSITGSARGFFSSLATAASATTTSVLHFNAGNTQVGAGATLTNEIGFFAGSGITSGTNNYGFYGDIASGSNRFNVYMAGTADNYFAGNVGIGATSPGAKLDLGTDVTAQKLFVFRSSNSKAGFGVQSGDFRSFAPSDAAMTFGQISVSDGTTYTERMRIDTSGNVGIGTATANKSSSSTALTVNTGTAGNFAAVEWASGDTLNYHINANNSAIYHVAAGTRPWIVFTNGSERMRIDSSGNVGIGGTASADTKFHVLGTYPTSSNVTRVIRASGTIPSGTTSTAVGCNVALSTQAASFTLDTLYIYSAGQGTIGSGSSITNQYGFQADSSLTGATNNYGFYGNIASGSNRWNFYAAGTAQNYFAGNTLIGSTTAVTNSRLLVRGVDNLDTSKSFVVEDSAGNIDLYIRGDGEMYSLPTYNRTSGSAANVGVDSAGGFYRSTSSLRYKSDVVNATHGLADVLKLRSVTYKGKNDGDTVFGGLIAEEVHDAGLTEFVAYDKEGRPDALHYGNMVALLVKAVQELTARVAELEAK
jgi:hypothetical protein